MEASMTLQKTPRASFFNGPFARYAKFRVRMRRECRERFPRHCR